MFPATEDRFGAIIRTRIPYVGSVGALDMVNFGAPDSVPERYRGRLLHQHNPQVTLMRTTPDENAAMGRWIGERLNLMEGPVRFLLPEGGVSALDEAGKPFFDTAARRGAVRRAGADACGRPRRGSSFAFRTISTIRRLRRRWRQHFARCMAHGARARRGRIGDTACRDRSADAARPSSTP